ncbi:Inner membrane protein YedI [Sinobacterium norvegicum]|uniref:Inner membrane protein YedI n=1 Tax=Sinobacterium norvegicum TaxID=1641715 RepID=A0ABM9AGV3_9GAMM|nr:DUF808 domain-containing protein [Sinobacterium norvegicum]CAH0992442.1 Inner membrane protein YedI [Sinobacterium norvegicum]
MAGVSLLALIDKITVALDDVALMTKVAAKKTAGVLGDDLALNAQQVSGVRADRELPVVYAVAKGSALNKLILVPVALLISAVAPWLITPLLMLGGAYLCFEGVEKIAHTVLHHDSDDDFEHRIEVLQTELTIDEVEKQKIKGAVRTDFILSAEIIVIALGTVQQQSLSDQIMVVSLIAAVMTVGVYGLVAGIVKLDDAGLYLLRQPGAGLSGSIKHFLGRGLLSFAPRLMASLSVIGTAAMFLVGGSILIHGVPMLHHIQQPLVDAVASWPIIGSVVAVIMPFVVEMAVGMAVGVVVLIVVSLVGRMWQRDQT